MKLSALSIVDVVVYYDKHFTLECCICPQEAYRTLAIHFLELCCLWEDHLLVLSWMSNYFLWRMGVEVV